MLGLAWIRLSKVRFRTILGSVSLISYDFGSGNDRVRFVGYPVQSTDRTVNPASTCISSLFCCLRLVSSTKFADGAPQLRWF